MSDRDLRKVPEPRFIKQRRSAFARVLYSLFLVFSIGALLILGLGLYGYSGYVAPGPLTADKIYEVPKGLGVPEIASALEANGIIDDADVFTAAALVTGKRGRLKAGEYEFQQGTSIREALNLIASGKAILYKLSVPEGLTTNQALDRVRAHEVLVGDLTLAPPEGAVMPDTYVFRRGKTRDELVKDMVEAQEKLLVELWPQRAQTIPVKTKAEAVTLASIVEKETAESEERPLIAAVFANRLKLGMRLQSDPTIIYGITEGKTKLDRPISRQDIAGKTAYNTYQIDGLPPGPIANPGRAALKAVLNPATSKALYFVADGSGGHAFAETLAEHNANVRKWRQIEKNRGQVEAAEAEAEAEAAAIAARTPEPAPPAAATPTLPAVETLPASAPRPVVATLAPTTPEAATPTAEPPPAPVEETPPVAAAPDPEPGTVIRIADRLVPIPVPKPAVP